MTDILCMCGHRWSHHTRHASGADKCKSFGCGCQDFDPALVIVLAVGDAIRDLGSVPSGELYARLMGRMSLETYNKIISTLKGSGLVKESAFLLTWIGPKKE